MFAKRFFYVCAGLLCLAVAYHFGAVNAAAQAPGNPVVAFLRHEIGAGAWVAVTANGDIFTSSPIEGPYVRTGNVFGGPTPVQHESFGSVKARYR